MSYHELSYLELKKIYNKNDFTFETTEELPHIDELIGQNRADCAMEFGLRVKNSKYNIFIVGMKGTGKKSYAKRVLEKTAKTESTPDDWCYVYNFKHPETPTAINMSHGRGKVFRDDMKELLEKLIEEIPKAFSDEDNKQQNVEIIKKYKDERAGLVKELTQYCKENGFEIKNSKEGIVLLPIINGVVINSEEYINLDEDTKNQIEKKVSEVEMKAMNIIKEIRKIENKAKESVIELENEVAEMIIKPAIDELAHKYEDHEKIINYLKEVYIDIMENLYGFQELEKEEYKTIKEIMKRYSVNVFVDNGDQEGAPVIIENNPTYANLVGKIEYSSQNKALKTDYTMIKAGSIHRANGGYLVIQARELLSNVQSWETLKRVLETGEVQIESLRGQLGITDVATLKPDSIPINIKVVLIGEPYIYRLLYMYDESFEKLFKVKVDFDMEMEASKENIFKMTKFISAYCNREGLRHLDPMAVIKILELSHRISGSQRRLTTRFDKLIEILIEADTWAEIDGSLLIREEHVKKAYEEKVYRNNRIKEKTEEMYKAGKILLDITGKKIGQVIGLSVINLGDYVFGRPCVITATTFAGNKGVVNIEREADLSGNIHDKGIMILEGYLSQKFAQKRALSLTSKICFEQSYSMIDGDSASSAELYALLSSLSDLPLSQYIAVTGSVNQKGEIQPIGGVSEKIEGFFSLCKHLGLSKRKGVLIPHQNVDDLVLSDEVIEAVKLGDFHIYPIKTIEEGIEVLTDRNIDKIFKSVENKLKQYEDIKK